MCRKYSSFVKGNFWNLYFYSLLLHMYQALKFQISWYWIVDYVLNRFREPMLKIGSVSSLVLSPAPSGKLLPRFFIHPWEERSTYLMHISTTCLMQAFLTLQWILYGEDWCLSFFGFLRPDILLWRYKNKCSLVALCCLTVRRPNLEVVTMRLLHQLVKILG